MTEQGKTVERIDPAFAAVMPAPQGGALPTGLEWQALERMAQTLADSDVIPYRLKRKPADVAVILLAAREYGIPPLMALSKLPVVNGTPAPMGELMVALVLRAGHYIAADFLNPDGSRYDGGPVTPEHYGECRYSRRDWTERETLRFTLAEAINAGLIDRIADGRAIARVVKNKGGERVEEVTPWEQYTPNMARWRAVSNACRLAFADVLMGLSYLPEELGAVVDGEGAPVDVEVVRQTPTGSIEDRTAQESADKLAEQPWPDHVLDAVRERAEADGYIDRPVTYHGEGMTLAEALERHIADRKHADTVDADVADTTASDYVDFLETVGAGGPELTAAMVAEVEASGLMDDPVKFRGNSMTLGGALELVKIEARERANPPAQRPADTPPDAQKPAPDASDEVIRYETPPSDGETPQAAALDTARAALAADDPDLVLSFYNGSADLREVDVSEAIDDDDLATIGLNPDEVRGAPIPLGGLLIKVGQYVKRHGNAVRYAGRPTSDDEPLDPWAADAAAGWPDTNKGPE